MIGPGDDELKCRWRGFMVGLMVVSLLGLPIVLIHGGAANVASVALSLGGTVALVAGFVVFANRD